MQWREYFYSCLAHYKRYRSENRHHRNPSIIWARRTFWIVFFYTAVTFALLIVNWRVARIARDTEERQLCAYVFPDHVQIYNADSDTSKTADVAPKLEILIKDSRITPAYHVINLVAGALLPFPFPFSEKRVQPGPGVMKIASVFFLPNGGVSTAFANVDGAPVPLTAEQKRLLGDGRAAIYLYGYIVYYDAFEIMRCTRYNYYVGGDAGFNGTDMKNGTEWRDVDKNCYEPAEVPPPLILPEVPHSSVRTARWYEGALSTHPGRSPRRAASGSGAGRASPTRGGPSPGYPRPAPDRMHCL